jgi:HPt (histidine-containing phosphotransfer) domain-containing protein
MQNDATYEIYVNIEIFNLIYLFELDDADYTKDVLPIFLETTPLLLDEMRVAAMHESWEDVHKKAHKLKSSLGILQAAKMLEETTHIESLAKQRAKLDKVPLLIQTVLEQFNLIQPMLKAEMAEAA